MFLADSRRAIIRGMAVRPFSIDVPDAVLGDLKARPSAEPFLTTEDIAKYGIYDFCYVNKNPPSFAKVEKKLKESKYDELAEFVSRARSAYDLGPLIVLGFSNGANIAAALLVLYPKLLAGAVLLRAMAPFKAMPEADLTDVNVLLASGASDNMIPKLESDRLAAHRITHQAHLLRRHP